MKPLPHDLNLFSSYGKGVLFIPVLSVAIAKQVQAASLYYSVAVHQEPVHTAPATLLPFLCTVSGICRTRKICARNIMQHAGKGISGGTGQSDKRRAVCGYG